MMKKNYSLFVMFTLTISACGREDAELRGLTQANSPDVTTGKENASAVSGYSLSELASTAELWRRWETNLTSEKNYANPYADVTVSATYTAPSGRTYTANAFWDEGYTFKLRFMFPETGNWQWSTTCSDATNLGLCNQNGSVLVAGYLGTNLLYKRGYLQVSANKRFLIYGSGAAFFLDGRHSMDGTH